MKKLAIFVEGQTEQIFTERLLSEIAGPNRIQIKSHSARGGGQSGPRTLTEIRVSGPPTVGVSHFVMLVDCGTDNRVRSDVADQYESLVAAGYSAIIAIRDVFPDFTFADVSKHRAGLSSGLGTNPIKVVFVLGIMEVESWFIAEHTHFQRISPSLTVQAIITNLGFDPEVDDLQLLPNPASDLHNAYQLAGFTYGKSRKQVERTVESLDYARLYLETGGRFADLEALIATIDDFLS